MFDLPWQDRCRETLSADVPDLSEPWAIGAIVGPSGSGKTSIARAAFDEALHQPAEWEPGRAVIDGLGDHPIRQIVRVLTAVGFSSPPAWLKPHQVLSTGEKFRCELARALLRIRAKSEIRNSKSEAKPRSQNNPKGEIADSNFEFISSFEFRFSDFKPLVFDEYTTVVDRTVAKIASAALARSIRRGVIPIRFVAVTAHADIIPWLQPDWVLDMAPAPTLTWRRVTRPPLRMHIERA